MEQISPHAQINLTVVQRLDDDPAKMLEWRDYPATEILAVTFASTTSANVPISRRNSEVSEAMSLNPFIAQPIM